MLPSASCASRMTACDRKILSWANPTPMSTSTMYASTSYLNCSNMPQLRRDRITVRQDLEQSRVSSNTKSQTRIGIPYCVAKSPSPNSAKIRPRSWRSSGSPQAAFSAYIYIMVQPADLRPGFSRKTSASTAPLPYQVWIDFKSFAILFPHISRAPRPATSSNDRTKRPSLI